MRRAVQCLLLLGSNQGLRRDHLRRATKGLARIPGAHILASSPIYETAPVGPPQRKFLNQAVRLSVPLSPIGLLIEAKRLEALAGRKPGPRWGPRPLDIDIVAYDGVRLRTPWLCLPHPAMKRRCFALKPLNDIAPRWPLEGRSVSARLKRLIGKDCIHP